DSPAELSHSLSTTQARNEFHLQIHGFLRLPRHGRPPASLPSRCYPCARSVLLPMYPVRTFTAAVPVPVPDSVPVPVHVSDPGTGPGSWSSGRERPWLATQVRPSPRRPASR